MDKSAERRGRLENGAELVAFCAPHLHSVAFSVVLPFTPECTPGVYHLVEHMFFERAGERRADEINAEMTARGSEIMGYTAINYMCFSFTCRPEVFVPQLELLFSMLSQREYEREDFEKVLPVIRNEIFEAAFYDARSSDILRDLWFDSRYIAPVLGNADVLSRLDPQEIAAARASLFNRGMCLFLAGAFTPEHERRVLDTFGTIPLRRREHTPAPVEEKVTREINRVGRGYEMQALVTYHVERADLELKLAAHWLRSGLFDGLDAAFFRFFGDHGFQFYSVDGIYNIRGDELVFSYLAHITKKEKKKFEPLIDAFEEEAARPPSSTTAPSGCAGTTSTPGQTSPRPSPCARSSNTSAASPTPASPPAGSASPPPCAASSTSAADFFGFRRGRLSPFLRAMQRRPFSATGKGAAPVFFARFARFFSARRGRSLVFAARFCARAAFCAAFTGTL